jgi:hypothetical protein
MKHLLNRTILRKLFILGVMLTGLAFVSTSNLRSAGASAPCCEECESQLNDCLSGCGGSSSCQTACFQQNNSCIRHCVFCN